MERPTLPDAHPLRPYAEFMLARVDSMHDLMTWVIVLVVVLCVFTLAMSCAFAVFGYQKWMERKEIHAWRGEVVEFTGTCATLLATVKGWAVYRIEDDDAKAKTLAKAAAEMTQAVGEVPQRTAEKVVEVLQSSSESASGSLKTPPLPPPPPHRTDPD